MRYHSMALRGHSRERAQLPRSPKEGSPEQRFADPADPEPSPLDTLPRRHGPHRHASRERTWRN